MLLHLCFFLFSRFQLYLLKSVGNGWYIYPLCLSIRTMERMVASPIALAHVLSRAVLIFHQSLSLYNSRFNACRAQNARLDRANVVRILFHMRLFRQKFTIHINNVFGRWNISSILLVCQLWKGLYWRHILLYWSQVKTNMCFKRFTLSYKTLKSNKKILLYIQSVSFALWHFIASSVVWLHQSNL